MSAPLSIDTEQNMCYAIKRAERRETPSLMACSKVIHGQCSRCGKVGANHFSPGTGARVRDKTDWERERVQSVHAFFKAKRKRFPTQAQLRMFDSAR